MKENETTEWDMIIGDTVISSLDQINNFSTATLKELKEILNQGIIKSQKSLKLAKVGKIAKLVFGGVLLAIATGYAISYGIDPSQFAGDNMSLNLGIQYGCAAYWVTSGILSGRKQKISIKRDAKVMNEVLSKIDEILAIRDNFAEIFPEYADLEC